MKKHLPIILTGALLTAACLSLYILGPNFIRKIDVLAYDLLLEWTCEAPKSGRVAIVDIDEDSLAELGQWPWSRYIMAELTRRIIAAGASVVAFDIVFAEEDRTSPPILARRLNEHFGLDVRIAGIDTNQADFDQQFADALRSGKTILGCHFTRSDVAVDDADTSIDPTHRGHYIPRSADQADVDKFLLQSGTMTVSIPKLTAAAKNAFFNAEPDFDNIVRNNPLVWGYGDTRIYPSLTLEAIRLDMGGPTGFIHHNDVTGIEKITLRDIEIPTDSQGRLQINYRTVFEYKAGDLMSSFPSYSVIDVLADNIPPGALSNKIVFVGTSAVGLHDVKATPLTSYFAGVEVHATMVDNILSGDILRRPAIMKTVDLLVILCMGFFLTVTIVRGRSWISFLVALLIALASIKISEVLVSDFNLVYVPAWTIFSMFIIYVPLTMIKYWQEENQKRKVRTMFSTMVSRDVMEHLEKHPESFSLTGEKAESTMFFSDVAGFTTISESLEPEQLSDLLNRYLSPMTEIIMARRGYVDKYEGDAIMAEWGVPVPIEDHAVQACHAAVEQQAALAELRPVLREQFGHSLRVRMGLNSGSVTAGNMGSETRMQYTVMGDAVNQAARLEPANKDYGTSIMIGETTFELAGHAIETRMLDKLIVQGKTVPIHVYELLGKKGELNGHKLEIAGLYEEALRTSWTRDWDAALSRLEEILRIDEDDGPSLNLRRRILGYQAAPPPPEWQGEFIRQTKD